MVNNIKELQEQLQNEVIIENAELTLRVKELEQEKYELKKTLLAELNEGVHGTYQNLIAEKESQIKNLEEINTKISRFSISIKREKDKLEEELVI
jgi:hypothetical protein